MRFVYRPLQVVERGPNLFGVGLHIDLGMLMILADDSCGDWVTAPPIPGALVVIVGDHLAREANDAYRSTPHRVVNQFGQKRF